MRKHVFLTLLMCCSLGLFGQQSVDAEDARDVTVESEGLGQITPGRITAYNASAFKQIKSEFVGRDVDYYVSQGSNQLRCTFFVDAEPLKGWEHECYLYTFDAVNSVQLKKISLRLPPQDILFDPVEVRDRYGNAGKIKPVVAKNTNTNELREAAEHTYAIILSGGVNAQSNYNRYWNDCSFIYQTLVNRYGIPKDHIYPIMSDGDDPAPDMRVITQSPYSIISQPLDLDLDGLPDISLAATKANVKSVLSSLASRLNSKDHLFLYVIDHGGSDQNESFIWLWNKETLYASELADMIAPLSKNSVNVNVVLGQCYSGGFIPSLKQKGVVVSTACMAGQMSYACPDGSALPYDEFVYHWTCAINGADHLGRPLAETADVDQNGKVSMREAYKYAAIHDRCYPGERPLYASTPESIGEDLAFDYIPEEYDLYIKDNDTDTGVEPNMVAENFWTSPSIWTRNQKDGVEEHENPYFSDDHPYAWVYVKVHNRGKNDYPGGKLWVHVYYANASTVISDNTWKGREWFPDGRPTGGHCFAVPLTERISSGDSINKVLTWALPEEIYSMGAGKFHYCLMAKLLETSYDETYQDGIVFFNPQKYNDQAQKNVLIIKREDLDTQTDVYIRNIVNSPKKYALKLVARSEEDAKLFSKASVELEMTPTISNAWERGGSRGTGVYVMSNSPQTNYMRVRLESPENKMEDINLYGSEFDKVSLKFNFKEPATSFNEKYTLDLVQYDENDNILGGETFIVEPPIKTHTIIEVIPIPGDDGKITLTTNNEEFKSINWRNSRGETIGEGSEIVVLPTIGNDTYEVVGYTDNGGMAKATVCLVDSYGIKNVTPTSAVGETLNVELCAEAVSDSRVTVSAVTDGAIKISEVIASGTTDKTLDVSTLQPGLYTVSYMIGNEISDTRKFTKK